MNKKAQTGLAIVTAIMLFIVGMASINLLKPEIDFLRTASGLNCIDSGAISDGVKLTCLAVDAVIPLTILVVFVVCGSLIINKFVKRKS